VTRQVVGIAGVGSYLPDRKVDAWEAVRGSGISREKFESIGVREIHLAAEGEMPSSMSVEAGRRALVDAGMEAGEIDLIIYCGAQKDHSRWQASNKVQAELEAFNGYAFDLDQSSGGQNLALSVAASMIEDDPSVDTVLITSAERWDTSLEQPVLGHSFIFGDGASAAVLKRDHEEYELLAWAHETRGEHHHAICIPDVGAGVKLTPEVFERGGHLLQFYGPLHGNREEARAFVQEFNRIGAGNFRTAAERANVGLDDIDFVVTVNSSRRHIRKFLEGLGLDAERSSVNLVSETGLLGSADVFYNLDQARRRGWVKKGDLVALCSVAGGYSWGTTLLRA